MLALIQRVKSAEVVVSDQTVGHIGTGLLLFLGIEKTDTTVDVQKLSNRVMGYRVFSDDLGHMNLSLRDISGELLIVPQFTLAADTQKGLRPSFSAAAQPEIAVLLFDEFVQAARDCMTVETGIFGADMQVKLINDGPVTFLLKS